MKFSGLKVGDKVYVGAAVYIGNAYDRCRRTTVTGVGRVWFRAGRRRYRLDSGISESGNQWAYAVEAYERMQRVRSARQKLESVGIFLRWETSDDAVMRVYEALGMRLPGSVT